MPRKLSKSNINFPPPQLQRPLSDNFTAMPPWLVDSLPLPRLIVLDLDYTLWPFYSDIHISTPIRAAPHTGHSTVTDRNGEAFALYPDVPQILHLLTSSTSICLAVASKSPVGDLCREVLKLIRLPLGSNNNTSKTDKGRKTIDVFDGGLEIYEGTKLRHFEMISRRTGVAFHDMLFFDDERPNREVEKLGVTMRLVEDGLSWEELEKGIQQWRKNRGGRLSSR